MSSSLYRLSGVVLLVGGVLAAIGWLVKFGLPSTDIAQYTSPLYAPANALISIGALLVIAGLLGFHARQSKQAGILGLVGIALSSLLLAVDVIGGAAGATFIPLFVGHPQVLKVLAETNVPFVFPLLLLGAIGILLLGIATIRARVFPRSAGILLLLGLVAFVASFVVPIINPIGPVLIYAAFAWSGIVLVRGNAVTMQTPELVPQTS